MDNKYEVGARFSVGDRVRVTQDNADCAEVRAGDIGVVDTRLPRGKSTQVYRVSMFDGKSGRIWFFSEDKLESVGDDYSKTGVPGLNPDDPFERVIIDMVETNRRKRADYAVDGSPWSNFDDTANALGIEGFSPVDSANFNIEQKSARLRSLRKNGRLDDTANESVADTYLDRAVYAVIALAMHKYPEGRVA